jgi:hypothetical protein
MTIKINFILNIPKIISFPDHQKSPKRSDPKRRIWTIQHVLVQCSTLTHWHYRTQGVSTEIWPLQIPDTLPRENSKRWTATANVQAWWYWEVGKSCYCYNSIWVVFLWYNKCGICKNKLVFKIATHCLLNCELKIQEQ